MSLQFVLGNSGSGKSTYIYKKIIKEAAENPFKNYLVIVPEQFTMRTQQLLVNLSPNGVIMNIDVLSFKRLAYRIFDELGIKDINILEETGKNLVLRKVALEQEANLGVMRSNMNKIGYISEVKSLLSEFVQYNISPDTLESYIDRDDFSEALKAKLSDVLVMYRGFESFMRDRYITAEEILNVLSDIAAKSKILNNCELIFDEFTGFTPIQNSLLKTLLTLSDKTYVTLTIDANEALSDSAGMHELFDMPKKTIKSLMKIAENSSVEIATPIILNNNGNCRFSDVKDILFMEQNLFRKKCGQFDGQCENIGMACLKNPKEEMIYTARKINDLVRKQGYRYKDIAIVSGDVDGYSNFAREVFSMYEIPYFVDTTKDILFHPFIEFIRAALEVIHRDFSIESVFRFLRCGFCDIDAKDIDYLENYVLALGLRGKNNWSKKFLRTPRGPMLCDLLVLDELREKIYGILEPLVLTFSDKESTVSDNIISLYNMVTSLNVEEKLWKKEAFYLEAGDQVKSKEYGQIYANVMSILDKYVSILGQEKMSTKEFIDILDAGLDAAQVATIPPGYDCVTIGDIERTRLNDVKVMFFLGVNEGIIPRISNNGGIISQYERELLKEMDIELAPTAREQSFIQKYYLYLNMTKASEKLYLSYFRLDSSGKATQKSYLINTINRMFSKLVTESVENINEILDVSTPASAKSYLISGPVDDNWLAIAKMSGAEDILDARYSFYEGNPISRAVARALYGKKIEGSVTRLEKFAQCQYAHFLAYGLRLSEREQGGFANVDIGNIYHDALLHYSNKLEAEPGVSWNNIKDEKRDELALKSIEEAIEGYPALIAYATSQEEYLLRRMKSVFLRTVWALTVQVQKGKFRPDKFEYSFEVSPSSNMSMYGRIDRVDTFTEEDRTYIKIIDYKSGNTSFDLVKLYYGTQLQLAMYLDAVVGADNYPGGMLYYHITEPVLVYEDGKELDVDTAVLKALRPDGLINSESEVLEAFDKDATSESLVAPFKYNKDGSTSAYSKVASTEDFGVIREYANNKIVSLGEAIYSGEIKINPMENNKVKSCLYCSYKDVCAFKSKLPGLEARKGITIDSKDIIEHMKTANAIDLAEKGE